nr:MAG TPA: hypothetical protein [Caudoviricetes sp.]
MSQTTTFKIAPKLSCQRRTRFDFQYIILCNFHTCFYFLYFMLKYYSFNLLFKNRFHIFAI